MTKCEYCKLDLFDCTCEEDVIELTKDQEELEKDIRNVLDKMNGFSIEGCSHRFMTDDVRFYEVVVKIKEVDGL